ncbi:DUF423 domain-containing protein [Pedobacter montanisoli]|uniref:DUF423 domain-containing protein n=1 Tax=Pedobacter montanisoli TaxID=2923277 RepID=A0ABS9ZZ59_9SPHI|nr:DUF423 domain-containing protein [Pedobacter montanisoli]MCJ0743601.1 DUF423 domain-containing protein [Pedobacter montanisoli]
MNKKIILTASFFGALAVILGAFGAHGLKNILAPDQLSIWQKGVEYQFYHTFAILYLSTFARYKNKLISLSFLFFSLGIILFSGSLYLLAVRDVYQISFAKYAGPVTPIGGVFFVMGWIGLFLAALRDK